LELSDVDKIQLFAHSRS